MPRLHLTKRPRIANRRRNLPTMPHNARITHQRLDLALPERRHSRRIKPGERSASSVSNSNNIRSSRWGTPHSVS